MARSKINYTDSISTLDLSYGSSIEEIKEAYRKLAKQYHPDVYQLDSGERFKEINAAYRFLRKYPDPPENPTYQPPTQTTYNNRRGEEDQKRRAYYKRKEEKKEQEAHQKSEMFKWVFAKVKPIIFLMVIFNCLLAIDYFLPDVKEEVGISKIETVRVISKYSSSSSSYTYNAHLSNGKAFRLSKSEIGKIDMVEKFELKRSRIFQEPITLRLKSKQDVVLFNEYGLFRVFGFIIPSSLFLIIAYFFLVKNSDYRLTIFLILMIISVFQLFLVI
jgi:hypothetical protein